MKKLLLGNEALALGAAEAGVRVATAYPGTPSTEIIENCAKNPQIYAEWSPNEKVALEVGIGAAIGGARTLVAMKHVGVNVAADPLFTLSYVGVNGGLVLVSADDPAMHSSQNEQDNRGYGRMAKLPIIEPADCQEIKDMLLTAYEISEKFDTPVMYRITTRLAHSMGLVSPNPQINEVPLKDYVKDTAKYVMLPGNARLRHEHVEQRMSLLREFSEATDLNRIEWGDRKIGIITSGVVYQYAKEILPDASYLKLAFTHPLPQKKITEFIEGAEKAYVIEELEPIIEEQIKSWGLSVLGKEIFPRTGEFSPELIADKLLGQPPKSPYALDESIPARPPVMCPGCPHRGIFYQLNRMKLTVSGDIGCYTLGALAPLSSMDTTVCMGASISMALGLEKARGREFAEKTVAVIGDSTFIHSGITPLIDVLYNQGTTTVIILDNSTTAMTGHQDHPGTGYNAKQETAPKIDLEALVRAIGVKRIQIIDPLNPQETKEALKMELAAPEPSVIIARRPCVLLEPPASPNEAYQIDLEACIDCKICLKTGCPALEVKAEKIQIKADQCSGCGLCPQVCPVDAIRKEGA